MALSSSLLSICLSGCLYLCLPDLFAHWIIERMHTVKFVCHLVICSPIRVEVSECTYMCLYIYIYTNTHFISNVSNFNTHTCSSFSLLPKLYCCELPHSPYSKPTRPLVYIASSLEALVECGLLTKHVADIANIDTNRKNDMAELININTNCNHGLLTCF